MLGHSQMSSWEETDLENDFAGRTIMPYPAASLIPSSQYPDMMEQHRCYLEQSYPERHQKCHILPELLSNNNLEPKGREAETRVLKALRSCNEPGTFIIQSKKFCVFQAGEIDFLIISKTRGVVLFEVKSGIKRKAFNDAEKQLEKAQAACKRKIKKVAKGKVSVRYAVVLSNVSRKRGEKFSPESCFDEDLESIEKWLDCYMPPLKEPLSVEVFDNILLIFLSPCILYENINKAYGELIRLTPQQVTALNGCPDEYYICGPAGSGKTELVMLKAKEMALEGQKTLIIVFNNPIKDYIECLLKDVPNLSVKTFHKLLWDIYGEEFSSWQFKMMTSYAKITGALNIVREKKDFYWESIFVDEAQMLDCPWEKLIDVLHKKGCRHLKWVFFDENQAVGFSRPPNARDNQIYRLPYVMRNTIKIVDFSRDFYRSEREISVGHTVIGPDVTTKYFTKIEIDAFDGPVLKFLEEETRKLLGSLTQIGPQDICFLTESIERVEKLRSRLSEYRSFIFPRSLNEMVRDSETKVWRNVPPRMCGVTIDSVSRCAGLHAKVVILMLSKAKVQVQYEQKMYLGITRACCKLIVVRPSSEDGGGFEAMEE